MVRTFLKTAHLCRPVREQNSKKNVLKRTATEQYSRIRNGSTLNTQAFDVSLNDVPSNPFLFIRNLPFDSTPFELSQHLSSVASPSHVKIVRDKLKKFPLYAFASFQHDSVVETVIQKLHGQKFKTKPLDLQPGIPESKGSTLILSHKRREKTGLIAASLRCLNEPKSIKVQFIPPLLLSHQRSVDFFSCLLPASISVSKVYVPPKARGEYIFELPSVLYAASLGYQWNEIRIPFSFFKNYLTLSEASSVAESENECLLIKTTCLCPHVNKIGKTLTTNGILKNPAPLCIENVATSITEQQLFHILKGFGLIRKLRLEKNSSSINRTENPQRTSFALVYYKTSQAAIDARNALNGKLICGRQLKVFWALGKKVTDDLSNGLVTIAFPNFQKDNPFGRLQT